MVQFIGSKFYSGSSGLELELFSSFLDLLYSIEVLGCEDDRLCWRPAIS